MFFVRTGGVKRERRKATDAQDREKVALLLVTGKFCLW